MERGNGYSSKKFKNERGSSVSKGSQNVFEDVHKVAPSPVVHVRGLSEQTTDSELREAVINFGTVSYVMRIPNRNMALIEFEDVESATHLVTYAQSHTVDVGGKAAQFNYSTSSRIKRPDSEYSLPPNCVILLTIQQARHPITVEVVNAICCQFGTVLRIVIFRKTGVQAMVEFDSVESAAKAKQGLQGQDIYSGCCTIKSEFARPESLNVKRNDNDTWDFTLNAGPKEVPFMQSPKNQPLLAEPKYGAGPLPFGLGGGEPQRRGMPYNQMNAQHHMMPSAYPGIYGGYPTAAGGSMGYPTAAGSMGYPGSFQDMSDSHSYHTPLTPMALLNAYESVASASNTGSNNNCVLMVYGMEVEKFNCQRLFNLFCLYGNVIKIKFLKTKEGSAMVQMGDREACERIMNFLNGVPCFGSKLSISLSKQPYLQDVVMAHQLSDGTSAYGDYVGSRNQRFTSPDASLKSRPVGPTTTLYFYNAPPNISTDVLRQVFENVEVVQPDKIAILPSKSERSSRGMLQWYKIEDCIDALVCANHSQLQPPAGSGSPFILKLMFSNASVD